MHQWLRKTEAPRIKCPTTEYLLLLLQLTNNCSIVFCVFSELQSCKALLQRHWDLSLETFHGATHTFSLCDKLWSLLVVLNPQLRTGSPHFGKKKTQSLMPSVSETCSSHPGDQQERSVGPSGPWRPSLAWGLSASTTSCKRGHGAGKRQPFCCCTWTLSPLQLRRNPVFNSVLHCFC